MSPRKAANRILEDLKKIAENNERFLKDKPPVVAIGPTTILWHLLGEEMTRLASHAIKNGRELISVRKVLGSWSRKVKKFGGLEWMDDHAGEKFFDVIAEKALVKGEPNVEESVIDIARKE